MTADKGSKPRKQKAQSPSEREQELIALAYDEAERRLRDGTASSQIIASLLQRGSPRAELEDRLLETQVTNVEAKTKAIESSQNMEKLVTEAMQALNIYGNGGGNDE